MNRINNIASSAAGIALLGVMLISCSKFLEVTPSNVLSVNDYNDVKALMGAHLYMHIYGDPELAGTNRFYYDYDNEDYLITQFYADDLNLSRYLDGWTGSNNKGTLEKSINWMHDEVHEQSWTSLYTNIGYYNMILEELEKHPAPDATQENWVKAEAKVLRAWCFYRLMQFFSPYHNNELGLPLNTDADAVGSYDGRRQTQTENYAFIIGELNEVLEMDTEPSSTYNVFFDKQLINALLSSIYLYKGDSGAKDDADYQKAVAHAEAALTDRLTLTNLQKVAVYGEDFGLHKDHDYAVLSFMLNDNARTQNVVGNRAWDSPQYPTDELYALFGDNDLRKTTYFAEDGAIIKYDDLSGYSNEMLNLFTTAELKLIVAESLARMGDEAEALNVFNEFVEHRYTTYSRPEGESLLDCILVERRKEFCFDHWMRWTDLTRLQSGFSRPDPTSPDETHTIEDEDYRFTMPIPRLAELSQNKIDQNPGWGSF